jgi:hypothetical protein
MEVFKKYMRDLGVGALMRDELDAFSFDLHDLSLANIFVDQDDPSEVVCPIPCGLLLSHLRMNRLVSLIGSPLAFGHYGSVHIYRRS